MPTKGETGWSGELAWSIPAAFALAYVLTAVLKLPCLIYLPELHTLTWSPPEGAITMGWYGRILTSLVLAAPLALIGAWLAMRLRQADRNWPAWLASALVLLALAHIAWEETRHWILR